MKFCGRIVGAFLGGGSEWGVVVVVLIPAPAPVLQLPPIELKSMEKSEMSEKEGRKSVCSVLDEVAGVQQGLNWSFLCLN